MGSGDSVLKYPEFGTGFNPKIQTKTPHLNCIFSRGPSPLFVNFNEDKWEEETQQTIYLESWNQVRKISLPFSQKCLLFLSSILLEEEAGAQEQYKNARLKLE